MVQVYTVRRGKSEDEWEDERKFVDSMTEEEAVTYVNEKFDEAVRQDEGYTWEVDDEERGW